MKIFKITLTALFLAFLLVGFAHAQENPDEMAKKYNVSFPVAELGNCTSFAACRAYCDNEANRDACVSFAKKKGFYKEEEARGKNPELLKDAESTLGCSSEATCRAICEKEENVEKCTAFAKKHNLSQGARGNPGDRKILEKAKTILGCDSESSCRSICENPTNQEKCSEFAKQTGLGGGVKRVGPGGCNSEESCRSYCEGHMDECRKFGSGDNRQSPSGAIRRGPGGCNSEESCKAYCVAHPSECGGNTSGGREPSGQQDIKEFCKNNPDKCSGGRTSPVNPEEFCKQNPDKCKAPSGINMQFNSSIRPSGAPTFSRPEEYKGANMQRVSPQQYQGFPQNNSGEKRRDVNPGQSQPMTPPPVSQQSIKGTSTKLSLWQKLLDFFFHK